MDIIRKCEACDRKKFCKIHTHKEEVVSRNKSDFNGHSNFTIKLECKFAKISGPTASGQTSQHREELIFFDSPPCDTCDFPACWVSKYNTTEISRIMDRLNDTSYENDVKFLIACKGYVHAGDNNTAQEASKDVLNSLVDEDNFKKTIKHIGPEEEFNHNIFGGASSFERKGI